METGTYISGLGHFAVIGWALLGGSLSDNSAPPELQVTDVSLISEVAFAALISDAPRTDFQIEQPAAPSDAAENPTPPTPDDEPKQATLTTPDAPQAAGSGPNVESLNTTPHTDVQTDAPELADQAATDTIGASLIVPTATIANRDTNGVEQPERLAMVAPSQAPAPRVDTTPAPVPDPDAARAQDTQKATVPDGETGPKVEDQIETAPEAASTEIITEAKESATNSAPVKTSRPRGRPANLAEKPSGASEIEQALAQAQAEAAAPVVPPKAPSGPPLTSQETDGLRFAVQQCWNVNPSSEAARITVVISFAMEKGGQPLLNTIRLVSASKGAESAKRSAYDAARRAIIRCANGGYKLPVEKFDHWSDIEMTFNPEKMRIK